MTHGMGAKFPRARAGGNMPTVDDLAALKAAEVAAADQYESALEAYSKEKDRTKQEKHKAAYRESGEALREARRAYRETFEAVYHTTSDHVAFPKDEESN